MICQQPESRNCTTVISVLRLALIFCIVVSVAGLPELKSLRDVDWLRSKLLLGATDAEAVIHLKRQIADSLASRATQFNDACHLLKHA